MLNRLLPGLAGLLLMSGGLSALEIQLDWDNNTESDLSHYSVYRKVNNTGSFSKVKASVSASAWTDTNVSAGNTYTYYVTASDTSSNESNGSNQVTVTIDDENNGPGPEGTYQQSGGLLVVEAENSNNALVAGSDGRSWSKVNDGAASDGAYMVVANDGTNALSTTLAGAKINIPVNITSGGAQTVWALVRAPNGSDNSIVLGLDGTLAASWSFGIGSTFTWQKLGSTVSMSAGEHVINIAMREDGTEIDKILVTTDAGYTPTGSEAESVFQGAAVERFAQSGGLVTAEVEDGKVVLKEGTGSYAGLNWEIQSGSYAIVPEASGQTIINTALNLAGPQMVFPLDLSQGGTQYLWALVRTDGGTNDSVHIGVDGAHVGAWSIPGTSGFQWREFGAVTIGSGDHDLVIAMREAGTAVDAIALSTDANYDPTGTVVDVGAAKVVIDFWSIYDGFSSSIQNTGDLGISSVELEAVGGQFDAIGLDGYTVDPDIGDHNNPAKSAVITLNFASPLAAGATAASGGANNYAEGDIDGSWSALNATVTFTDGSTVSGALIDVGDSDDGDARLYEFDSTAGAN
jgi:hypothetical protein